MLLWHLFILWKKSQIFFFFVNLGHLCFGKRVIVGEELMDCIKYLGYYSGSSDIAPAFQAEALNSKPRPAKNKYLSNS
jgi:hypothetical protein